MSSASNRVAWITSCNDVQDTIGKECKRRLKKYVTRVDIQTKPSEVWRTIQAMDERRPPDKKNEVSRLAAERMLENQFARGQGVQKQVKRKTQAMTDNPSETDITMEELESD